MQDKGDESHTTDVEAGEEEGNPEELVTKEGKDETGDHEHDRHNGGADCDLVEVYFLCVHNCMSKSGGTRNVC